MYKCLNCGTKYDLSDEHYNYLKKQIKENPVVETIISCPGCKLRRIVGGELDWDEIEERDIIMMFGRDLTSKDSFKEFEGIRK